MFTIGKVAKEAGVGIETVRFYERKGLIKQPKKQPGNGFRYYTEDDASKIRFIKRAQELGFTLSEAKELVDINANPRATCASVGKKTEKKLAEVELKINDLIRIKKALIKIQIACDSSPQTMACCRIMDCFEGNC